MKKLIILIASLVVNTSFGVTLYLEGPHPEKPTITQTYPHDLAKTKLHIKGKANFRIKTEDVECNSIAVQDDSIYDLTFSEWLTVPVIDPESNPEYKLEKTLSWSSKLANPSVSIDSLIIFSVLGRNSDHNQKYMISIEDVYQNGGVFARDRNRSISVFKTGVKMWYPNGDSDIVWEDADRGESGSNVTTKSFPHLGSIIKLDGGEENGHLFTFFNQPNKTEVEVTVSQGIAWEAVAVYGPSNMPNDVPGELTFQGYLNYYVDRPRLNTARAASFTLRTSTATEHSAVLEYSLQIGVAVLGSYLGGVPALQSYKHILSGVSLGVRKLIGELIIEHDGDVFIGGSASYAVNIAGGNAENHFLVNTGAVNGPLDDEIMPQSSRQVDKEVAQGNTILLDGSTWTDVAVGRRFIAKMPISSGDGAASSSIKGSYGYHLALYGSSDGADGSGIFGTVDNGPLNATMGLFYDMNFIRNTEDDE
jgi:hypothetical protein